MFTRQIMESDAASNSSSEKCEMEDESSEDTIEDKNNDDERMNYIRIKGKFVPCQLPKYKPLSVNSDTPLEKTMRELRSCMLPDYTPVIAAGRALTSAAEASSVISKASSSTSSDYVMEENQASETKGREERDTIYYYANLPNMQLYLERHLRGLYEAEGIIEKNLGIESKKAKGFPEPGFLRKSENLDEWGKENAYNVFMAEAYNDIVPDIDVLSPPDSPYADDLNKHSEIISFLEKRFDSCSKELIHDVVESREKTLQLWNCLKKMGLPKSVDDSVLQSLEQINVHVSERNNPRSVCKSCQKFVDVCVPCTPEDKHMNEPSEKDEEKQLLCLLLELQHTNSQNLAQKNKLVSRLAHRKEKQSWERRLDDNAKKMWDLYTDHLNIMKSKRRNGEDLSKITSADINPIWAEEMPKILTEREKLVTGYKIFTCTKKSDEMDQSTVEEFRKILQDIFP